MYGALGVGSHIKDFERISILDSLFAIKLKNIKILGQTCNLIIADAFKRIDTIAQVLHILALFKYKPDSTDSQDFNPDKLFIEKCSQLIKNEPVLKWHIAPKLLWSLYAMGYDKDKDLIQKLLNTVSVNHKFYNQNDTVSKLFNQ